MFLEQTKFPKYLSVTLDRSLIFMKHCKNTRAKVNTRKNILRKLVNTKWGANANTLRTTAIALNYLAAKYACLFWKESAHAKIIDIALDKPCRIVTGCLRPTEVHKIYTLVFK